MMKHILWLIALTITIDMVSSQGYQQLNNVTEVTQQTIKNFYKVPPSLDIKPFQLGGKMLNKNNLKDVPEEQISLLLKMAYPSMLERWYGKSNGTITQSDLETIDKMPENVRKELQFKILPTQASCCMSSTHCCNTYGFTGCMIGCGICFIGSGSGLLWGICSKYAH